VVAVSFNAEAAEDAEVIFLPLSDLGGLCV
jgi:hypothetical protein